MSASVPKWAIFGFQNTEKNPLKANGSWRILQSSRYEIMARSKRAAMNPFSTMVHRRGVARLWGYAWVLLRRLAVLTARAFIHQHRDGLVRLLLFLGY